MMAVTASSDTTADERSALLPGLSEMGDGSSTGSRSSLPRSTRTPSDGVLQRKSILAMQKVMHTPEDNAATSNEDTAATATANVAASSSVLLGSTAMLKQSLLADQQRRQQRRSTRLAASSIQQHGPRMTRTPSLFLSQRMSRILLVEPILDQLQKVPTNFLNDTKRLAEGSIPQSIVLASIIGTISGVACYVYYTVLFGALRLCWHTLPEHYLVVPNPSWLDTYYWLWIPLVSGTMITGLGLTVLYVGDPGDLPYVISRIHTHAYIPMNHVTPTILASLFSIVAGGSLGPEAPLVAICGALGGYVSRNIFRQSSTNVVRKHTFMGMSGALAAFFGVPLGGSLFALEVCSRFGVEYFEHIIESIFCGVICLLVFRSLLGKDMAPIWNFTTPTILRIATCPPVYVLYGALIGLYGAFLAYLFAVFHGNTMELFGPRYLNLLENHRAVYRGWFAGIFIVALMVLVPHTAFWGEEEIQVVAMMGPASSLPNIFPTTGLIGFEMDSPFHVFIVGCAKLCAISFTVAGGFRGGYIFPLMCAGSAFGRLLYFIVPVNADDGTATVPFQLCVLCTAAAINVAITRTALATTLILTFLSGEHMTGPAILMASICSLFATSYMPFIKSQITRSDIDHSLFHEEHHIADNDSVVSDSDASDDENDFDDL